MAKWTGLYNGPGLSNEDAEKQDGIIKASVGVGRARRVQMASTYVQISREDLEAWLATLPLHGKAYLLEGKAGVYMLPLSESVAVKLNSTIGSKDDAMDVGRASMQLALVSRVVSHPRFGPMTLNKKAQGQSHFARTLNWKTNWKEGVERMKDAYMKAASFYDAIATIEDREKYQNDLIAKIEGIPNWRNNRMLADFHAKVSQGGILTGNQLTAVEHITHGPAAAPSKPNHEVVPPPAGKVDDALLGRMRALWVKAKGANDLWLIGKPGETGFLKSVADRVKDGMALSPKQTEILERNFGRYGV